MANAIVLSESEQRTLEQRARTMRAEDARRARVILLLAEGLSWSEVCERLDCSRGFVARWRPRFLSERLAGIYSRHRGPSPSRVTPKMEARIPSGHSPRPAQN